MKTFFRSLIIGLTLLANTCPSSSQWAPVNTGVSDLYTECLAVSGGNLFMGAYGGVNKLNTNGTSWTQVYDCGASKDVAALASNNIGLMAGISVGGVIGSTDNGTTWSQLNSGLTNLDVRAVAISTAGTHLFAGTSGSGVYVSTNNGTTWTSANTGLTNMYIFTLAVSGSNIFAGTNAGIFLSSNNGASWTAVNTGLPVTRVFTIAVSGNRLFAGTANGVYSSTNNGTNWGQVNYGLTNIDVRSLTVTETYIFAGTNGGGVFYSQNNGGSWSAVNTGLTNLTVYGLSVFGNYLYAGIYGGGVCRRPLSELIPSQAPPPPTLISPADGATTVPLSASFTWNASNGASSYRTQLSTNSNFTSMVFDIGDVYSTNVGVVGLLNNTVYYWRVNASNTFGTSAWSATRSFTTSSSVKITSTSSTASTPTYPAGTEFWVEVKAGDPNLVADLYGISFRLKSDNASCTYVAGSAVALDFLGASPLAFFQQIDNQTVDMAVSKTSGSGATGDGYLAKAKFTTPVSLTSETVVNFSLTEITAANSLGGTIVLTPQALVVKIIPGTSVWPGDCDNNGTTTASDLLRIGLFYGQSWPKKPATNNPGVAWNGYFREKWTNDVVPEKKIYADANGDGSINSADVLAIGLNYGKTHTLSTAVGSMDNASSLGKVQNEITMGIVKDAKNGMELSLVGDFMSPVYGISMKLNYHGEKNGQILPGNLVLKSLDTTGSILGTSMQFVKENDDYAWTDLALTRMGGEGIIGRGKLVKIHYSMPETWDEASQLILDAADIVAVDGRGLPITITVGGYHGSITSVNSNGLIPENIVLRQNYPNPFNPSTTIQYDIPKLSQVRIDIFDILGRHVTTLVNETKTPGSYSVEWNAADRQALQLSSGIYTYRLCVKNMETMAVSLFNRCMILSK